MANQLRKIVTKSSKLRNDFVKDRNDASHSAYRNQRKPCVTFRKKPKTKKKQYSSNLDPKLNNI